EFQIFMCARYNQKLAERMQAAGITGENPLYYLSSQRETLIDLFFTKKGKDPLTDDDRRKILFLLDLEQGYGILQTFKIDLSKLHPTKLKFLQENILPLLSKSMKTNLIDELNCKDLTQSLSEQSKLFPGLAPEYLGLKLLDEFWSSHHEICSQILEEEIK